MTSPAGASAAGASLAWRVRGSALPLDRPRLLGILNVTPDSFSDGGDLVSVDAAVARAARMVAEGADIVDVGGESTRPQGATAVDAAEELRRVLPVVRGVRQRVPDALVSVDTVKAVVARAALDAGAHIINDVSGGRLDPAMAATCAEFGAGFVVMHSRGTVQDMATFDHATYDDVVADVVRELRERVDEARAAGVADDAIVLDPGIGFSKRSGSSLAVLAGLPRLAALGFPVLVGASRKRFVGELSGVDRPADRVFGTVGAHVAALMRGARLFRVHDVAAARQSLDVAWAVLRAESPLAALAGAET
ncbi:MAG TPA: dihydropteroate synthase [Gemmatimonadaceae bacterium]|nr:dihydropteroate synthase [Gemmatimonadaceae bacterium]